MIKSGAEMGTAKHSGEFDIRAGGGGGKLGWSSI